MADDRDATDSPFPLIDALADVFPTLHAAQRSWLAAVESLPAPDRKSHELIRLALTTVLGSADGVRRHSRLAAEVGATWEDVAGSVMLTVPGFGVLRAVEALPWAREGFDAAEPVGNDNDNDDGNGDGD